MGVGSRRSGAWAECGRSFRTYKGKCVYCADSLHRVWRQWAFDEPVASPAWRRWQGKGDGTGNSVFVIVIEVVTMLVQQRASPSCRFAVGVRGAQARDEAGFK